MIHFLLDSSLGLLMIFVGIRFSQHIARVKNWESFNFGEYGNYAFTIPYLLFYLFLFKLPIAVKVRLGLANFNI